MLVSEISLWGVALVAFFVIAAIIVLAFIDKSILPQIRSMAQPMVAVIPTLFAGMLLGGISVIDSLIVVLLLTAAAFVSNVLSGVVALQILSKTQN